MNTAIPAKARRREWIGLAVLAIVGSNVAPRFAHRF
jgi:hypothetical protein